MNSENSKIYEPHRLLLNLSDKKKKLYNIVINILLSQILVFTICGKIYKSHTKTINLKYQLQSIMIYIFKWKI